MVKTTQAFYMDSDTYLDAQYTPRLIVIQPKSNKFGCGEFQTIYERDANNLAEILRTIFCTNTLGELKKIL